MKKIIYILVVVVIIAIIAYFVFFKKQSNNYDNEQNEEQPGTSGDGQPKPVGQGSSVSTPSLKIDGKFGQKTEDALYSKSKKRTVTYDEFMYFFNLLVKKFIVDESYDKQYDKITAGIWNSTTKSFIINPATLIDKKKFPLAVGSEGPEVVMLQIFLKYS